MNRRKIRGCLPYMLVAFGIVTSLEKVLKVDSRYYVISNSIISLVLIALLTKFIYETRKIITKRNLIYSTILSVIYSTFLVLGTELYLGHLDLSFKAIAIKIIYILLLCPLFICINTMFLYYLPIYREKLNHFIDYNPFNIFRDEKRTFFMVWGIIFLAWFIIYLAFFPGIFSYDCPYQFRQADTGEVNTFHPIVHTYFISIFMWIGKALNSFELGLAMLCTVQMLLLSAAMAYGVVVMSRLKVSNIYRIFSVMLFALLPINALFSFCPTKDIMFSVFVLLLFLNILEMTIHTELFFKSKKKQVMFVVMSVLMFAFRQNGIYAFILTIPLLVISFKNYRKKLLCLSIAAILIFNVGIKMFEKAIDAKPLHTAVVMSVPVQQLANAMNFAVDRITDEEKEIVYEIISPESIQKYDRYIADPVMFEVDMKKFSEDPIRYFKVWFDIGLKCPSAYINAFLSLNLAYWYPDMIYPQTQVFIETSNKPFQQKEYGEIKRTVFLPLVHDIYSEIGRTGLHQRVPILSMLCSPGFNIWLLIFYVFACIYYKRYKLIIPIVLLFGIFCTIIMAPAALLRYAYSIMICVPVAGAILFNNILEEKFI